MAYRIRGLSPAVFAPLFTLDEAALATRLARRVVAHSDSGYPCRVSLTDAAAGETLILVHHVSHDVATPFRAAHAIFVRQDASPAEAIDRVPAMLDRRRLSLRGFDATGMLHAAALADPGAAEDGLRGLFADPAVAYIHAHNAAHGCFLAAVTRHGDPA